MININGNSYTYNQIQSRLENIGKITGKKDAWIQEDLSVASSSPIARFFWTFLIKHSDWARQFFYGVNLDKSKRMFVAIGSELGHHPNLVPLFNQAVRQFNTIAPRHIVNEFVPAPKPLAPKQEVAKKEPEKPKVTDPDPAPAPVPVSITGTAEKIRKNAVLVFQALEWLKSDRAIPALATKQISTNPPILDAAKEYLEELHHTLAAGKYIPIPFYYHATGGHRISPSGRKVEPNFEKASLKGVQILSSILQDQLIKMSHGNMGFATYLSSNDETDTYGEYSIVFDKDFIEQNELTYFPALKWRSRAFQKNYDNGLWLRLKKEIPLHENNMACLVANERDLEKVKNLVATSPLRGKLRVLNRSILDVVRFAFDSTYLKREYPGKQWQPYNSALERSASGLLQSEMPKSTESFPPLIFR